MRLHIRILQILFLCLAVFSTGSASANNQLYPGPDDPATVEAAVKAVAGLGASGGALCINRDVYNLIGTSLKIEGANLGLQSEISDVQKSLSDLGAQQTDLGYKIELSGDVLFDFDKATIKPEAEKPLLKLATAVNGMGSVKVSIFGHTDSKGSDAYNMDLSKKRANSVRIWLSKKMTNPQQVKIISEGKGESEPVAENTKPDGSDNPEGRAKNRRVEILISETK